jgi:hypothetical protein
MPDNLAIDFKDPGRQRSGPRQETAEVVVRKVERIAVLGSNVSGDLDQFVQIGGSPFPNYHARNRRMSRFMVNQVECVGMTARPWDGEAVIVSTVFGEPNRCCRRYLPDHLPVTAVAGSRLMLTA